MNPPDQEDVAAISSQIIELELLYAEELRKSSSFTVRKSIRFKIRALKSELEQLTDSNIKSSI